MIFGRHFFGTVLSRRRSRRIAANARAAWRRRGFHKDCHEPQNLKVPTKVRTSHAPACAKPPVRCSDYWTFNAIFNVISFQILSSLSLLLSFGICLNFIPIKSCGMPGNFVSSRKMGITSSY